MTVRRYDSFANGITYDSYRVAEIQCALYVYGSRSLFIHYFYAVDNKHVQWVLSA